MSVLEYHCQLIWLQCSQFLENAYHCLRLVKRHFIVVEAVKSLNLPVVGYADIAESLLTQHSVHHSLITIRKLLYELFGVFFVILHAHPYMPVSHICFHIKAVFLLIWLQLYGLHGAAHKFRIAKQAAMPRKSIVGHQMHVIDNVDKRVSAMLHASRHQFLLAQQQLHHRSVIVKKTVHGYGVYEHSLCPAKALVLPAAVHGACE